MNLPVFIGQMLEEAKRFLKKNDCMENIYIYERRSQTAIINPSGFSTA
jgi:hypothetical protein